MLGDETICHHHHGSDSVFSILLWDSRCSSYCCRVLSSSNYPLLLQRPCVGEWCVHGRRWIGVAVVFKFEPGHINAWNRYIQIKLSDHHLFYCNVSLAKLANIYDFFSFDTSRCNSLSLRFFSSLFDLIDFQTWAAQWKWQCLASFHKSNSIFSWFKFET